MSAAVIVRHEKVDVFLALQKGDKLYEVIITLFCVINRISACLFFFRKRLPHFFYMKNWKSAACVFANDLLIEATITMFDLALLMFLSLLAPSTVLPGIEIVAQLSKRVPLFCCSPS